MSSASPLIINCLGHQHILHCLPQGQSLLSCGCWAALTGTGVTVIIIECTGAFLGAPQGVQCCTWFVPLTAPWAGCCNSVSPMRKPRHLTMFAFTSVTLVKYTVHEDYVTSCMMCLDSVTFITKDVSI